MARGSGLGSDWALPWADADPRAWSTLGAVRLWTPHREVVTVGAAGGGDGDSGARVPSLESGL